MKNPNSISLEYIRNFLSKAIPNRQTETRAIQIEDSGRDILTDTRRLTDRWGEPETAMNILATTIIAFSVLLAAFYEVRYRGLCCADDAYFATISRELAETGRYGIPLASDRLALFHPEIGSGPALILPGALMIWLFGAELWVPAATSVLLVMLQLVALSAVLGRVVRPSQVALFSALTLACLLVVSRNFRYFGVFVGELPALLFVLIGAAFLVARPLRLPTPACAGLAFALAILTKQIALLSIVGIVATWWLPIVMRDRARGIRMALTLVITMLTPLLAYEVVRFMTVGTDGYLQILAQILRFGVGNPTGIGDRFESFLRDLSKGFTFDLAALGALAVTIGIAVWRWQRTDDLAARLSVMLAFGGFVHLTYIHTISIMWLRYYYIGVGCLVAAMTAPLLAEVRWVRSTAVAAVIALGLSPAGIGQAWRQWHDAPLIAPALHDITSAIANYPDDVIVSRWWGTFFDIGFTLPRGRRWLLLADTPAPRDRAFLFVNNEAFAPRGEPAYEAVRLKCNLLLEEGTFRVQRCPYGFQP